MYRTNETLPATQVVVRATTLRRLVFATLAIACIALLGASLLAANTRRTLVCARAVRGGAVTCAVETIRPGFATSRRDLADELSCARPPVGASGRGWARGRFAVERGPGSPTLAFEAPDEHCTSSLTAFDATPLPNGFLAASAPGERRVALGVDVVWLLLVLASGLFGLLFVSSSIILARWRLVLRLDENTRTLSVAGKGRPGAYPLGRESRLAVHDLAVHRVYGIPIKRRELWLVSAHDRRLLAEGVFLSTRQIEQTIAPLQAKLDEIRGVLPKEVREPMMVGAFPSGPLKLARRFVWSRVAAIVLAAIAALSLETAGLFGRDAWALPAFSFYALLFAVPALLLAVQLRAARRAGATPRLLRMRVERVVELVNFKRTGHRTYVLTSDELKLRLQIVFPKGRQPFFADGGGQSVFAIAPAGAPARLRSRSVFVPSSDLYPFVRDEQGR